MTFVPAGTPPIFLFLCFIFGSLTGYLAYFLTSWIERVDSPGMKPFGIMAYVAFLAVGKNSFDVIESDFWIVAGIFIALWVFGIVTRGNSTNVFDRIIFFGCALLMTPFLSLLGYLIIVFSYSLFDIRVQQWDYIDLYTFIAIYITVATFLVFASPLIERLYYFAASMRSKE